MVSNNLFLNIISDISDISDINNNFDYNFPFIIKNISKSELIKNNIINKNNHKNKNKINIERFIKKIIKILNIGTLKKINIINNRYTYNIICYINNWNYTNKNITIQTIIKKNNSLTLFSENIFLTIYNFEKREIKKKTVFNSIFNYFQES